jgi:ATP phosphoribosyltransferase regulatory subunit
LCYAGSTLHTRPKSLMAPRSPIQLGAELYGDGSLAADIEVIRLMLTTLETCGLENVTLDLGHVGIYQAVLASADLNKDQEAAVFDALQRKSRPDLELALAEVSVAQADLIVSLIDLHGEESTLDQARELYSEAVPLAMPAIEALAKVAMDVRQLRPNLSIYFDLAELRGLHYHTGMVFAAYIPGHGQALANGGRYDDVGKVYGRARPATGFSTDLKALMKLVEEVTPTSGAISMPDVRDAALEEMAAQLRGSGEIVINCPSGQHSARCDRQLVDEDGSWIVRPL